MVFLLLNMINLRVGSISDCCHPNHFAKSGLCGLPYQSPFMDGRIKAKPKVFEGAKSLQIPDSWSGKAFDIWDRDLSARGFWRVERKFNCLVTQPEILDSNRESNAATQNHSGWETTPLSSTGCCGDTLLSLTSAGQSEGTIWLFGNTDVRRQFHHFLYLLAKLLSRVCHELRSPIQH